ncbi:hypothetical protein [Pseudooceanicola sp.]|uniref:hypothetical protein n=1 Tax=Pseudooceanicola sp. TaxID=1914328 RepID=UPI00405845DF
MPTPTDYLVTAALLLLVAIGLWLRRYRKNPPEPQTEFDRAMADHIKKELR